MELLIAPKIPIRKEIVEMLIFLDIEIPHLLSAILKDLNPFDSEVYEGVCEEAISVSFGYWGENRYDRQHAQQLMVELEHVLKQWLFCTVNFEFLCYFFCRNFKVIETNPEVNFATYYLEMDALQHEIYRSNPSHIRESLLGHRSRFLNG